MVMDSSSQPALLVTVPVLFGVPDQAMRRLSGALAGYNVLFVEKPDSLRATHDVKVTLTRHAGRVHATSSYSARNEQAIRSTSSARR
jgi:hypothetical protein